MLKTVNGVNLEGQLLTENSKSNALHIAGYVGNDPDRFHDLITLLLKGCHPVSHRAAWAASLSVSTHPDLVTPYLEALIDNLSTPGLHPAVRRNSMKILEAVEIPSGLHGKTINICFHLLSDKKEPVAIKALAMTVLYPLIQHEPGLKKELRICIEDQMPYTTAAFQSRGKKILEKLK